MSTSISTAFIAQYERDVHEVFQRRGSLLMNTVRRKDGVVGATDTFQKIGKGIATTKARHGDVTPMNQDHTAIPVTLADFYAGDYVDKLDEAKTNIDERMAIASGGAMALGRKVDDQIMTALDGTTQTTVTWTLSSQAAIRNGAISSVEALWGNDVQNDGECYAVLSPHAWAMLMTVDEFKRADYVQGSLPYVEGAQTQRFKDWMGVKWQFHTGVPSKGTSSAKGFLWHKTAIGYASGAVPQNIASAAGTAIAADIQWVGPKVAHWVNHWMSGGCALIDDTGVIEMAINDTTALPTS